MNLQAIDTSEMLSQDEFVLQAQHSIQTSTTRIQPVGNRTKAAMIDQSVTALEMSQFSGIVAYDPSEFLITAKSGTTIAQLVEELGKNGQYLPFDPLFVDQAATLGGTIASGISGPDRLLYGGVRDFVMEVAMLDGLGKLVRGGGKVVKNAAGFDSPKMMVGSYGRLGVLLEATLKVFPKPQAYATLLADHSNIESALQTMARVLRKPLPICSVVIDPTHTIAFRIAGPTASLDGVLGRIQELVGTGTPCRILSVDSSDRATLIQWLTADLPSHQCAIRVGCSSKQVVDLDNLFSKLAISEFRHCGAGSISWLRLNTDTLPELNSQLRKRKVSGVVVRGQCDSMLVGDNNWLPLANSIQQAIDPNQRFPRFAIG